MADGHPDPFLERLSTAVADFVAAGASCAHAQSVVKGLQVEAEELYPWLWQKVPNSPSPAPSPSASLVKVLPY